MTQPAQPLPSEQPGPAAQLSRARRQQGKQSLRAPRQVGSCASLRRAGLGQNRAPLGSVPSQALGAEKSKGKSESGCQRGVLLTSHHIQWSKGPCGPVTAAAVPTDGGRREKALPGDTPVTWVVTPHPSRAALSSRDPEEPEEPSEHSRERGSCCHRDVQVGA